MSANSETIDLICRLLEFDTVSSKSNLPLIQWVEKYLLAHGIKSCLSFDPAGGKANLFATVGGQDSGGIVLAGHTDTVPVEGQNWTKPPFCGTVSDGKLFGRGAVDMKSFIGICLALVPELQRSPGKRPIHLALTFDEETSMLGARTLVADLRDRGVRPLACLVGEPTQLKAVVGHKGRRALRCCVSGRSAHSSLPAQGVNAIEHASRIISHLRSMAERHRLHEERHYGYDVPYSTIVTTRIVAGVSTNTVPPECSFDFEFRHLPWTSPDELEAEIRAFAESVVRSDMVKEWSGCDIRFDIESSLPAFGSSCSGEGLATGAAELLELLGRRDAPLGYMAFATEASLFQQAGIPTIVCGPGSIEQAHKPDEYITLTQVAAGEQLLRQLVRANQ
ncbi:MAG: acetylornithine deacetylase [Burkholderiales bacterium]|nr:acetylornithine deacetylase [Burkholderiales bacterium]